jgi:hypothetical protein
MRALSLIPSVLFFAAVAAPAHAQVYRWVDDRGVVNYSSKSPSNANGVVQIDAYDTRLSIVHGATRPARADGLRVPPTPAALTSSPPGYVDRATLEAAGRTLVDRERCFAERRVDCANPTGATYDFGPAYSTRSLPPPFSAYRAQ